MSHWLFSYSTQASSLPDVTLQLRWGTLQSLLSAGILAQKAVQRGLSVPPWIKTSLSPGSGVVTHYLEDSGVLPFLSQLGFQVRCPRSPVESYLHILAGSGVSTVEVDV